MITAILPRRRQLEVFLATAIAVAAAFLWWPAGAQGIPGFDGFIQSGTCESPTSDLKVDLESPEEDFDVMPYLAKVDGDEDQTVELAFYGAPETPGFGFPAIFTDEDFSLVITEGGSDTPVACGNLLEPDDENFEEAGLALVRLHPVANSGIEGAAIIERTSVERENDVISTRARILLIAVADVSAPPVASPAASPVPTT